MFTARISFPPLTRDRLTAINCGQQFVLHKISVYSGVVRENLVRAAMANGVGFVCAHCTKFWEAKEKRMGSCQPLHGGHDCAGPLAGSAFPRYEGPLKNNLTRYCFVCGQEPSHIAEAPLGMTGVCETHVGMFENYSRPGERPAFISRKSLPIFGA